MALGTEERFVIDGRSVDEAECRQLCLGPLPDRMRRVLDLIEGERLLDIGCYVGGFAKAFAEQHPSGSVTAIDYDPESVRIARVLHPEMANSFLRMSVYELDLPDGSMDCVTFQEVIEHLEGAALAVKEINRVLRPGGALIVTTPNPYYWRQLRAFVGSETLNRLRPRQRRRLGDEMFEASTEWNRHILCWTPATLLTLMTTNGFAYVHHEYSADAASPWERGLLRALPFLGPVIVLKVRKVGDAPARIV